MLFIIFFVFGFGTYTATSQTDFLGGADQVFVGAEAEHMFERDAGFDLPPGAEVVAMLDAGFQDRYTQTKLSLAFDDLEPVLALLGTSQADLVVTGPNSFPSEHAWWDVAEHAEVLTGEIRLGQFTFAQVVVAQDPDAPGRVLLYITAFNT